MVTVKYYIIKDRETNKAIKVFKTKLTGRTLERFERGLFRKVDLDRFYIDESTTDPGFVEDDE